MFDTDHNLFWILVFAIPIVAIISNAYTRSTRYRALAKLAEQGKPIPPELMALDEHDRGPRNQLRGGIAMVSIGIGIAIFFWAMTGASGHMHGIIADQNLDWLPAIGAIPFMIGVGLLISAALERRQATGPK
ncbi:MAG TPA: DUF6249 domain-containing protein [Rhizomicrobium sp.]|jgi:hypothetical protein